MSPSTKWGVAIVGLLAGNLIAMVVLVTASSASSAQIIPDYYDRAVHYDDAIDEAARSSALGWSAKVVLASSSVEVRVRDKAGAPIEGAVVRVSGYPRAHAAKTIAVALSALGDGAYRATLPARAVGRHDLTVVVERDGERFTAPVSVEAR